MKKGKLFVISGPSGVGKGSICRELLKEVDMDLSVSMTTRKPREGEVHGTSYYFVTEEEFLGELDRGGLLEHAKVYDNYYGTPRGAVMEKLEQGRDVLLEIEMLGAMQVKEAYGDAVTIFVVPPSLEELRSRLEGRGTESRENIEKRLGKTKKELEYADQYDYIVVNDSLSDAVDKVKEIIAEEKMK